MRRLQSLPACLPGGELHRDEAGGQRPAARDLAGASAESDAEDVISIKRKRMPAKPNNLDAYWMPFTANRAYKAAPRMMVAAEGMYYTSDDGRRILDGTAGLWCCN